MIATIQPEPYTEFLDFMNLVFTAFFAFEFVVKFAAFGLREYVKDPWNNFDFIIVIGSFLDIIMAQVCFSQQIIRINPCVFRLELEVLQFLCSDFSGR